MSIIYNGNLELYKYYSDKVRVLPEMNKGLLWFIRCDTGKKFFISAKRAKWTAENSGEIADICEPLKIKNCYCFGKKLTIITTKYEYAFYINLNESQFKELTKDEQIIDPSRFARLILYKIEQ